MIRRVLQDENGATAVEYGIMIAAIAGVIITMVFAVGSKVKGLFDTTNSTMSGQGM